MPPIPTLLFFCHHSVGIGHLVRSFALVESLKVHFRVVLLSGGRFPKGFPVPEGIEFIQLPPLELDENQQLKAVQNKGSLQEVIKARTKALLQTVETFSPDVVITELFPFGRAQLAGELIPFLRKLRRGPKQVGIYSSIRDIVEPGLAESPMEKKMALSLSSQFFDGLLIHSNPDFIRLESSFPELENLKVPLYYTGFVTNSLPRVWKPEGSHVVVSAGGGKVGGPLLQMTLDAYRQYGFGKGVGLKMIGGPLLPQEEWEDLVVQGEGVEGVDVLRSVTDLQVELAMAYASVSQCGYNTSMELLQCKVPALVLPFTNSGNSEQVVRANQLAQLGLLRKLEMDMANPERLAREIRETINFIPANRSLEFDGAQNTTRLLVQKMNQQFAQTNTQDFF